jgi:hypothetical protein
MDRTNEMPDMLGLICGFDAGLVVSKKEAQIFLADDEIANTDC